MKASTLTVPATLIAAGAFASPAMAITVDYTASPNGTSINIVGDSSAEYLFTDPTTPNAPNTLGGKYSFDNTVGTVSATPYFPSSDSNTVKTRDVTADGYYGLYFQDGASVSGGPSATSSNPQQYTGWALVDRGGTHISEIEFQAVSSAVPEPESWALMLLGFGAAGAALRQRRRTSSAAAVA